MQRIQRLYEQDFITVRDFYWDLIDKMQASPYLPGWEKGIYPSDAFLAESLKNRELYVLKQDETIIAAMVLNHLCNDGYAGTTWAVNGDEQEITIIHALGVLPDFQGQGIAKKMVQAAIQATKDNRQKAVRLDVLNGNEPALRLYKKMGFQFRRTVPMFYEDTGWTDYLLFELPL